MLHIFGLISLERTFICDKVAGDSSELSPNFKQRYYVLYLEKHKKTKKATKKARS